MCDDKATVCVSTPFTNRWEVPVLFHCTSVSGFRSAWLSLQLASMHHMPGHTLLTPERLALVMMCVLRAFHCWSKQVVDVCLLRVEVALGSLEEVCQNPPSYPGPCLPLLLLLPVQCEKRCTGCWCQALVHELLHEAVLNPASTQIAAFTVTLRAA